MWNPHRIIHRRRLTLEEVQASSFCYVYTPLHKIGFRPHLWVLVLRPESKPLCVYVFRRQHERLFLFFSRADDMWFVHRHAKGRFQSASYSLIEDFEAGVARYFRLAKFTPDKRPVIEWPPRRWSNTS